MSGKIDALVSLLVLRLVRLLLWAFPHRETSASIERQHEGWTTGRRPQTASFPMKRVDCTDPELCWTWDPRRGFGLVWNSLVCKERSCCPLTFWSWRVFWFSGRGSLRACVCVCMYVYRGASRCEHNLSGKTCQVTSRYTEQTDISCFFYLLIFN